MADKEGKKYKTLEEANRGYNEVYSAYQKGQEEGNLTKKELEDTRAELFRLKGGIDERTRREQELKTRLRQPGLRPEDKQRINEQFLEQMKNDPVGTFDSRIVQIIRGQGYVKKEELDKEAETNKQEEQDYNDFVKSHDDFEKVRPTFTKFWNKLPVEKRNTSNLELVFQAAKGEMVAGGGMNLEEERKKMREELIQEMKEKATLGSGRKIRTKKEVEADDKTVDDILEAHRSSKVSITR